MFFIISYKELGLNDFEVGYIHYLGNWKGWALEMDVAHIKIILSCNI
jgi:hypothetical protein